MFKVADMNSPLLSGPSKQKDKIALLWHNQYSQSILWFIEGKTTDCSFPLTTYTVTVDTMKEFSGIASK